MLVKCIICNSHLTINTITHYKVHEGSKKHQSALKDINEELDECNELIDSSKLIDLSKLDSSLKSKKINDLLKFKKTLETKLKVKYSE